MCFANSINIVWTLFYDSSTPGTRDLDVVVGVCCDFDQQLGASHGVGWSELSLSAFKPLFHQTRKKGGKNMQNEKGALHAG